MGRGLSEDKFLPFVSTLIGPHDVERRTSQVQRGGRSVSTSVSRETLFEVSDLAALPRGRAILMSSGQPAVLTALDHFSTKPYAEKVNQSETYYRAQGIKAGVSTDG